MESSTMMAEGVGLDLGRPRLRLRVVGRTLGELTVRGLGLRLRHDASHLLDVPCDHGGHVDLNSRTHSHVFALALHSN